MFERAFNLQRSIMIWVEAHSTILQRMLIVPIVLFASFVLAVLLDETQALMFIALPFLLIGVALLFKWPQLGLLILVAASLVFQEEIIDQIGVTSIIAMGLAGLWVLRMVMNRKVDIHYSFTYVPFISLIIVAFFSFGFAQLPWYPISAAPIDAQLGGVLIFIIAFIIYLIAANQIDDIKWLKWLTFLFLGICGIYLILRFFPGTNRLSARFVHFMALAHGLFWCWLVVMSFSQALFNDELSMVWRVLLMILCLAGLYVVLFETRAWVSGWLPALLAIVVCVWVAKPKFAYFLSLIMLGVGAFFFSDIVDNFIYVGDNAYSEMTRLEAWKIVFQIMSVNPIFGVGPANYSFYTPLFPILGWSVQFNSHNNYVDIIAQVGYLGLICLLWVFLELGKVVTRVRLLVSGEGFVPAFVYGTIGGFVATVFSGMLGDWILPYVYNITIRGMRASMLVWLFVGGLVALERILANSSD